MDSNQNFEELDQVFKIYHSLELNQVVRFISNRLITVTYEKPRLAPPLPLIAIQRTLDTIEKEVNRLGPTSFINLTL